MEFSVSTISQEASRPIFVSSFVIGKTFPVWEPE